MPNAYLLFALFAAILYAFAAPFLKLATERGMSSLQTTLYANAVSAVAFAVVFLPWRSGNLLPAVWWPVLLTGLLFFVGQVFTVLALKHGHASIATPALGSKVVIVALLLAFGFDRPVHDNVLVAAGLTTLGIIVLAYPSQHFPWRKIVPAVGFSLLAAAAFGLFDIMTQIWSPRLTFGLLMPWSLAVATVISLPLPLTGPGKWLAVPRPARTPAMLGVGLLTGQALLFISAVGIFNDAAGLNVVYGSRGVWSVVIVWLLGHHFSQHERFHTRLQVARRLVGAALIAAAVALVFRTR